MYAERLTLNDRDEILHVLNQAFSTPTHTADFERNLPIMWTGEHDYAFRHIGVRENGRLIALLGVYPLPVRIAGHELLFSTVGNVATLQEARGKGCMKLLMDAAMEKLAAIGADASRLDGLRSRYNRFGYDHAGTMIQFTLTKRNAQENPPLAGFTFRPIKQADTQAVTFARSCQQRSGIHALRATHLDFYMSMRAWQNIPYLALDAGGQPAGYLSVSADKKASQKSALRRASASRSFFAPSCLSMTHPRSPLPSHRGILPCAQRLRSANRGLSARQACSKLSTGSVSSARCLT